MNILRKHSLTTNGLDFLDSAVKHLTSKDENQLKYAVLHLFSGTLLILKEKIKQEHWSLLFQKVENASFEKYKAGDFEGINVERVLHILKEISQVKIHSDDLKALNDIRKIRNKIEHFEYTISAEQLRPIAGRLLNFIIRFYEVELKDNILDEQENEIFEELKSVSVDFKEYVNERVRIAGEYASENGYPIYHCITCFENALIQEEDDFKCFVCDLVGADAEEVAQMHIEIKLGVSAYDGEDMPIHECPSCSETTLVPRDENYNGYICVNCTEEVEAKHLHGCSRCGTVFYDPDEEAGTACSDCWSNLMSDD